MPAAKKPTRSPAPRTTPEFTEPIALKWLSASLDTAQTALAELRTDAGRDVRDGARDLYKDLRTFISSAQRDSGKLATALRRDFEQAQKRLAEPSRPAPAGTQPPASRSLRAARPGPRASATATSNTRSATAAATPPPTRRAPTSTTRTAILEALADSEAMTAAQIATATGLSRGTISTTLSRLAASGEITKAERGYRLPAH